MAPDGGWFGYANLIGRAVLARPTASTSGCSGLQILGISSMLAGFNFIVTIINMRAPGMTLMRMPVFVWMSFVTQFLIVLAFPAITVALILLMFDRFFGTLFYAPVGGRRPAALAAPVLDLRPSRGLHPDPARHGHRLRGAARPSRASRSSAPPW